MSYRNAVIALVLAANLAVGLAIAAQRGCFDSTKPKSVRHIDLASYEAYCKSDSKACLAEFEDTWVLLGGSVIEVTRVGYEFTDKWFIRLGTSPDQAITSTTLEFDGDQGGRIRQLKRGDSITVIGRVASIFLIDRCTLAG